jgi:hypothetical protein
VAAEAANASPPSFDLASGPFRTVPINYHTNPTLSCLDAWICYHLGEDKVAAVKEDANADGPKVAGKPYLTPPWKTLRPRDLKQIASQKTYLSNLNFLCKHLDERAGLTARSKPSITELTGLFKSERVQDLLSKVAVTSQGRERRIKQINWECLSRNLRKALKAGHGSQNRRAPKLSKPDSSFEKAFARVSSPPKKEETKKRKNRVENEDDDSFIEVVDRMPSPSKKPRKGKRNRPIAKGYMVPGPIPLEPDLGEVKVDHGNDWRPLARQGRMLNGVVTTAYLNALIRSHHHAGVRRSSKSFTAVIRNAHTKHGSHGGFPASLVELESMQAGEHIIDWETDPLIFLQIFRGHPECGHWALAVVDRTVWKQGIVVLFDSMPGCFPDTLQMLKEWLAGSPLTVEGCKWITANMPHQGSSTNDCGIWMCCMASLYLRGLLEHDVLANSGKVQEKMISSVSVVSRKDATEVGAMAAGT